MDEERNQDEISLRAALSSLLSIAICLAFINKASSSWKRTSACPALFARLRAFGRLLEVHDQSQTGASHLPNPKIKTEALLKAVNWIVSLGQAFRVTQRTCKQNLAMFGAHGTKTGPVATLPFSTLRSLNIVKQVLRGTSNQNWPTKAEAGTS